MKLLHSFALAALTCVLPLTADLPVVPVLPTPASQYFGIECGVNKPNHSGDRKSDYPSKPKTGQCIGVRYGYAFESGVRAELHAKYRTSQGTKQHNYDLAGVRISTERAHVYSWTYMANLLYGIPQISMYDITPYVGAGVGYCVNTNKQKTRTEHESLEDKVRENRFAYQLIAGLTMPVAEKVCVGFEYKYMLGRAHAKDHSLDVHLTRHF